MTVNAATVEHRSPAYIPPGSETLVLAAGDAPVRVILLGGVPLGEPIVMWWNVVGRDHDEVATFRRRYQAELGFEPADPRDAGAPDLFGAFPSGQPKPSPAPTCTSGRTHHDTWGRTPTSRHASGRSRFANHPDSTSYGRRVLT